MTTTVETVVIESATADDRTEAFFRALGLQERVRVRPGAPGSGFRGLTVSLVLDQPSSVDATVAAALAAGGTEVKPVSRSLWGYGGTVAAPEGTVVTVASAQKKDTGPATSEIQQLVVQLAVDDVAASTAFYAERGVGTGRRFGRRYAELDTAPVAVTLNRRAALAKAAGVPAEGDGAPGVVLQAGTDPFTDPDGVVWEPVTR